MLVGTDDGDIIFYDSSLRRTRSIHVHNDFIRKIRTSHEYIFTCSDDSTIKKIKNDEITILRGHEHFVMDIRVIDDERLLSCSLDMTLKLWNYKTDLVLMTFSGHKKGINAIDVYQNVFYSAGDDQCIRIWQGSTSRVIEKVSEKNIDHLRIGNGLIYTGSEDGYLKIFNLNDESVENSIFVGSRVWDSLSDNNQLYVATDSGLSIYEVEGSQKQAFLTERGLLIKKDSNLYLNDKEIGKITQKFEKISSNSKLLCLQYTDEFAIYSYLGFREKLKDKGQAQLHSNILAVLKNGVMEIYDDLEKIRQFTVRFNYFKLFNKYVVNYFEEGFILYNFDGKEILKENIAIDDIFLFGNKLIVISTQKRDLSQIIIIDIKNGKQEKVAEMNVKQAHVHDDVFYFMSDSKLFYLLPNMYFSSLLNISEDFLGIFDKNLCFFNEKIIVKEIDSIIEWQKNEKKNTILPGREKECLHYLINQNENDLAIELFDCKFEIFLEMNRLDDAFQHAKDSNDYKILGNLYLKKGKYTKAARAFHIAKDAEMTFICDFLGKGKYMQIDDNDSFAKCLFLKNNDGLKKYFEKTEFENVYNAYHN